MKQKLRVIKRDNVCPASDACVLINTVKKIEFMFIWSWQTPNTGDCCRVDVRSMYKKVADWLHYKDKKNTPYYKLAKAEAQNAYDNTTTRFVPFLKSKGYKDAQIRFDPYRGVELSGIDLENEEEINKAADAIWEFWQTIKQEFEQKKKPTRDQVLEIEVNYVHLGFEELTPYWSIIEEGGKKHLLEREAEVILEMHPESRAHANLVFGDPKKTPKRQNMKISVSKEEAEEFRSLKAWRRMEKRYHMGSDRDWCYPIDMYIL